MATFFLKIISSNKVFYEGPCRCLIMPAADGEKEVMAHHEAMLAAIRPGEMRMQTEEGGQWTYAVLGQGFFQIANNRATLLADTVERPEEIDAARAREAVERAREQLRQKQSIQEYHLTRAALAKALVRLKETEKFVK